MKLYKPNFWNKSYINFYSLLLLPISILLQLFNFGKRKLVPKKKFDFPVVCVGNLYLGGTGKTPLAIEIFKILKDLKKNPAIIRKGYKNQYDEADLIQNKTGCLITDFSRKNTYPKVFIALR